MQDNLKPEIRAALIRRESLFWGRLALSAIDFIDPSYFGTFITNNAWRAWNDPAYRADTKILEFIRWWHNVKNPGSFPLVAVIEDRVYAVDLAKFSIDDYQNDLMIGPEYFATKLSTTAPNDGINRPYAEKLQAAYRKMMTIPTGVADPIHGITRFCVTWSVFPDFVGSGYKRVLVPRQDAVCVDLARMPQLDSLGEKY